MTTLNDLISLGEKLVALRDIDTLHRDLQFKTNAAQGQHDMIVAQTAKAEARAVTAAAAVDAARAEALAIVGQAREDGETLKARAAADADAIRAAAAQAVEAQREKERASEAEERRAKKRLTEIDALLETRKAEVAAEEARLAKIREAIAVATKV